MKHFRNKLLFAAVLMGLLLFTAVSPTLAASPETETATNAESGVYYTVRYGDYLSHIAIRYGVTVNAILAANPHITNPNLIYAGTVLLIPTGSYEPPHPPHPPNYGTGGYCRYQHYVSYGENLSSISAWYGVSPWAVAEANSLYNLNTIYAGTYLCIP